MHVRDRSPSLGGSLDCLNGGVRLAAAKIQDSIGLDFVYQKYGSVELSGIVSPRWWSGGRQGQTCI